MPRRNLALASGRGNPVGTALARGTDSTAANPDEFGLDMTTPIGGTLPFRRCGFAPLTPRGDGTAEGLEAVVKQKVGPVSATFTGLVYLSEIVEGRSLKISGEGKGGVAGFAKGGANVSFEPTEGGTRLTYEAEANVGGKIAQLGSRIIDSFARKLADEFFTRFQAAVEEPEEDVVVAAEDAVAGSGEKKKGWFKRLLG